MVNFETGRWATGNNHQIKRLVFPNDDISLNTARTLKITLTRWDLFSGCCGLRFRPNGKFGAIYKKRLFLWINLQNVPSLQNTLINACDNTITRFVDWVMGTMPGADSQRYTVSVKHFNFLRKLYRLFHFAAVLIITARIDAVLFRGILYADTWWPQIWSASLPRANRCTKVIWPIILYVRNRIGLVQLRLHNHETLNQNALVWAAFLHTIYTDRKKNDE